MADHKTKIIATKKAGDHHQVLTVQGGGSGYRRKPCETCPWRIDAVGEFPAEAFRHSVSTAYDMAFNQFLCHSSGAEKPATCAGYLLRGAAHNLGTRISIAKGNVDIREVSDSGVELFNSYREMAEANGVHPDDPILDKCRD